MNIIMILPQAFLEFKGTSFSTLNRLKVLSKLGHKIDLLTYPVGKNVNIENVTIYRIPNFLFVRKVKIGPSWKKLAFDGALIIYAIKMLLIKKYDVIYSHEEAGFFSTFLAKIFNKWHVYDMHSSLPQQLINFHFTKSKIIIQIFRILEKLAVDHANAIIAICPALYKWAKEINDKANVYLIENVLDNDFDEPNSACVVEKLIQKFGLANKKIVLYAGTFEKYQGLDLLINGADKVIKKVGRVHFLLVGGHPNQVSEYRNLVKKKNLSEYFTFTGSVPSKEINCYYELSNILVSPRNEGNNTPLKIYAYLRSGKPIVATKHITHTQVLDEKVAFLTDSTPDDFAQGIIQAMENEKLAKTLSRQAVELAERKYSSEHYIGQIKKLFDSLGKETT